MKPKFEYYRNLERTIWIEDCKKSIGDFGETFESKNDLKNSLIDLFRHQETPPGLEFEGAYPGHFIFEVDIYETSLTAVIPVLNEEFELELKTPGADSLSKDKVYLGDVVEVKGMGDNQLRILTEFDSLDHLMKFVSYVHKTTRPSESKIRKKQGSF